MPYQQDAQVEIRVMENKKLGVFVPCLVFSDKTGVVSFTCDKGFKDADAARGLAAHIAGILIKQKTNDEKQKLPSNPSP